MKKLLVFCLFSFNILAGPGSGGGGHFTLKGRLVSNTDIDVYSKVSELNFSDIKAIKLHTGKLIDVNKEVESIQLAFDRNNKVDYIELIEGSVIDSYDIDKLIIKNPALHKNSTDYLKKQKLDTDFLLKRVLSDGSDG